MRKLITICAAVAMSACAAFAADTRAQEIERIQSAENVLREIMGAPDKGIPDEVLANADCVGIVPSMLKGGFIFGARYGKGVATCRYDKDQWSAPAPIRIEGGSWGLQIGGQAVDLVMLVMNKRGMDQLLQSKFKVGADVSAAAGPVGRDATANTDWKMRAEVLTYSRARGAFAGITLDGAVIKQDEDDTTALYGKMIPFTQLLSGRVPAPQDTQSFLAEVAKYYHKAKIEEASARTNQPTTTASTGGTAAASSGTVRTTEPSGTTNAVGSNASQQHTDVNQESVTNAGIGDAEAKDNISRTLDQTPGLSSGNVKVTVTKTTVELSGTVQSDEDKQTVRQIAERNAAGRTVVDTNLTVK